MFRGRPLLLHAVNDIDGRRACTEGTSKRRVTFTKFQVSSKSQVRSRRSEDGASINSASKIPRRLASSTYNPISEENDRNSLPNSPIQSLSEPPWFSCKLLYNIAAHVLIFLAASRFPAAFPGPRFSKLPGPSTKSGQTIQFI